MSPRARMISLALLSAALGEVTMPISPAWPAQVVVPNSLASIPGNSQFANPLGCVSAAVERYQQVYRGNEVGSGTITAIAFRRTDGLGGCIDPATPSVTVAFEAGTTRSFALFAAAGGSIALDPGLNRIFTRLRDASGTTRGSTSAAVCTAPNANC